MSMILKSEKGFSLIELMIAASVLSFIIYITTSLINNQMDNLKVFENSNPEKETKIKEPEMFEESNLEEDFEIPAFLRRQKN